MLFDQVKDARIAVFDDPVLLQKAAVCGPTLEKRTVQKAWMFDVLTEGGGRYEQERK